MRALRPRLPLLGLRFRELVPIAIQMLQAKCEPEVAYDPHEFGWLTKDVDSVVAVVLARSPLVGAADEALRIGLADEVLVAPFGRIHLRSHRIGAQRSCARTWSQPVSRRRRPRTLGVCWRHDQ